MQQDTRGVILSFTVPWTSLALTTLSGSSKLTPVNANAPALLDTGVSTIVLPFRMYYQLYSQLGAYTELTTKRDLVRCNIGEGSLDFGFGHNSGATVSVPLTELAPPAFDLTTGKPILLENGTQACSFAVAYSDTRYALLGDPFLRSAYVVYDLDNKLIGLAQSNHNGTSSNIVELPNGLKSL